MSRKPTIAELQIKLAEHERASRCEPVAYRLLLRAVSLHPALLDSADYCTGRVSIGKDAGEEFIGYGFKTRYSADVLILTVATGAGESITDVTWTTADDLDSDFVAHGSDARLAWSIVRDRLVTWAFRGER